MPRKYNWQIYCPKTDITSYLHLLVIKTVMF